MLFCQLQLVDVHFVINGRQSVCSDTENLREECGGWVFWCLIEGQAFLEAWPDLGTV